MRIAINGFGRIGRNVFRVALQKGVEITAVNDVNDVKTLAHLLKYDSVHGVLDAEIRMEGNALVADGKKTLFFSEREPERLPWKEHGIDVVIESSGRFTDGEKASAHLKAGAKKVVISAPAKNVEATVVLGVNDSALKQSSSMISMASCTTNCLAPVANVLHKAFKIRKGFMTTCHAYTNDQQILDAAHKDLRRARAGAVSIIPTTTGAAKAIGEVIPDLKGRLDGLALRVPIPDGSINDLVVEVEKEASREEVNAVLRKEAEKLKGILAYTEEPIVSCDVVGNPHSAIVDGLSTMAVGNLVKTLAWYDNEWGYSNRLVELVQKWK